MAKTRWDIEIGYTTNTSGLKNLEANFLRIQNLAKEPGNALDQSLQTAAKDAEVLLQAMRKCYNTDLGALNTANFVKELNKAGISVDQCRTHFQALANTAGEVGIVGQKAFNNLGSAILGTNLQVKEANKVLDNFARTFANTIKYNISGGIYREVVGSVNQAISYTRHLDTSLNDIRIVTDKSADSMQRFAKEANTAAKALGASTLDYTEASLIFYQQGLDDAETKARTEATLKAANVTGQSGAEVSEQLTAVWNGYKVSAEETELYVDKLAAVAASTAADLEELSTGMSKVASAANAMGVDVDQLNAQLATIVSVTRQAPESVGTALKTIYARMSTIEAGGEEEGTNLKNYTETMAKFGISVLDGQNKLRDMGSVMEEVGNKWATLSREQQVALAQAMAGTRQYNNLLALFENWDMYGEALKTSADAVGTLQHQQDIYMESTEAHLQKMRTATQGLYDTMINNNEVNTGIDVMTDFINVIEKMFDSFGGGFKSILGIGATIATLFSDQIGRSLANIALESQKTRDNFIDIAEKQKQLQLNAAPGNDPISKGQEAYYTSLQGNVQNLEQLRELGIVTTEEYNNILNLMKEKADLDQRITTGLEMQKIKYEEIGIELGEENTVQNLVNEIITETGYNAEKLFDTTTDVNRTYREQEKLVETIAETLQDEEKDLERQEDILEQEKQKYKEICELKELAETKDLDGLQGKSKERYEELSYKYNKHRSGTSQETAVDLEVQARNNVEQQEKLIKGKKEELDLNRKNYMSVQSDFISTSAKKQVLDQMFENYSDINNQIEEGKQKQQEIDKIQQQQILNQINGIALTKTLLGFVGSLSSSYLSIMNVSKVLNDNSLSGGQKAAQIGMTLSMTLPMLTTSIKKLKEGIAVYTSGVIKAAAAEKVFGTEGLKVVRLEKTKITHFLIEESIRKNGIKTTFLAIAAERGYAAAIAGTTKALINLYGAEIVATAGIAALVVAIVEMNRVFEESKNSILSLAKAQQDSANYHLKQANAAKEELDNITELSSAYEELKKSIKDNNLTQQEAKDQIYQLCLQYGQEELALKALTGEYNNLSSAIDEAGAKRAEIVAKESAITQEKLKTSMKTSIFAQGSGNLFEQSVDNLLAASTFTPSDLIVGRAFAGSKQDTSNVADTDMHMFESEKTFAKEIAKSLGYNEDYFISEDGKSATIDLNKELDRIIAHREDFEAALETLKGTGGDIEAELLHMYEPIKDQVAQYAESLDTENQALQQQGLLLFDKSITTYQEYLTERKKLLETVGDTFDTEKEANDWITQQLSSNNFSKTVQQSNQRYFVEEQLQKRNLSSKGSLDGRSKEEISFLALNIDTLEAYNTLDEFFDTYKDYIDLISKQQIVMTISGVMAKGQKDGQFAADDIDALFSNEDFAKNFFTDKETFNKLDFSGQQAALFDYQFLNADIVSEETKQKIITDLNTQLGDINEQLKTADTSSDILDNWYYTLEEKNAAFTDNLQQTLTDLTTQYEEFSRNTDLSNISNDQLKALEEYQVALQNVYGESIILFETAADGTITLTDKGVERLNTISQVSESEYDKLKKQAEQIQAQINNVNATTTTWKELNDQVEAGYKAINTSIDSLQSQYKDLQSIVEDYNNGQTLSLDSMQKLVTLDNAFVASLKLENGQLSINDDAYTSLVDIQKAYMEQQILLDLLTDVHNILEGEKADATDQSTESIYQQKIAIGELTAEMFASHEAFQQYINDQAGISGISAAQQEALDAAYQAYENKKQLLGSVDYTKSSSSGKSGGSKKDKELKKIEDEFDRYWDLNKAIDAVELSLSRLDKLQSNLHGKELIRSLQKENKLLVEQKSRYEDLYAEQLKEAGELQGKLANFSVAFDSEGAISNYAQATQSALEQFNQAAAAYNAGTLSEEAYDAAEKTYQAFKDALERYDTLYYDEMKKTQDKLIDLWKEELANNLEAWTTEIQIQLDLSEAERQWNDFLHDIGENFKAEYEDISFDMKNYLDDALTYAGAQGTISTRIDAISDVEREIDKLMGGQDSDMFESVSQAQEKLKELRDQLEDDALEVHNLWKKAWDDYLKSIDQGEKKLDDLMNKFKQIDNELEFQGQLIELIYGDKTFDLMNKLYDAQSKNSLAQVDSVRQQRDMWKKMYDEAEEGNADRAKYYDLWIEAQNNLNDLVVEHIELLKNDYLNTVNSIIDTVKKNTVGGDLDFAKTQWSDRKSMEEGFYDDTERVYQIETMQNKWEEVISNAPLNQQKKLTELMNQQLENLKNKTRLSEYDIGLAERELQIAQARLDLENAQNNKNSMKVTRGTDGNWSYQYVADDEDVANKQQALLDAINDKYEYIKQKNQEVLESLLENTEKYWERYYEILADTTLKDEEREVKLAELWETYYGEEGLLTVAYAQSEQTKQDLNQATFELLDEAYVQNVASYQTMTSTQQALIDGLKDGTITSYEDIQAACQAINDESLTSWQTMARDMADAWNADDGQSIKSQVLAAMDECQQALDEYGLAIDYLAAVADMDFSEAGIAGSINQAEQATEQLTLSTGILIDEIQSDLANALGVVNELEQSWYGVRDAIIDAISVLSEYFSLMGQEKEFNFDNPTKTASALLDSLQAGSSGSGGRSPKNQRETGNGNYTYWTTDNQGNKLYRDSKTGTVVSETQLKESEKGSTATDWLNFNTAPAYASEFKNIYQPTMSKDHYLTDGINKIYTPYKITNEEEIKKIVQNNGYLYDSRKWKAFATGGYTGEWGSEGRMAMLHEKELVLNAADTKNILSVVDTVRDLSGLGTSISSVIADGIANTLAKLAGIRSGSVATPVPGMASAAGNTFNITAEFPNANDVNEIREAILSLPNLASQYVNQKLK